jgi:hypothetical protein
MVQAVSLFLLLKPVILIMGQLSQEGTQQTHFKGVTLHLSARIIAWSPAPAEIE